MENWTLSKAEAFERDVFRELVIETWERMGETDAFAQVPFYKIIMNTKTENLQELQWAFSEKYGREYFDAWKKDSEAVCWLGAFIQDVKEKNSQIDYATLNGGFIGRCEFLGVYWLSPLFNEHAVLSSCKIHNNSFDRAMFKEMSFCECDIVETGFENANIIESSFVRNEVLDSKFENCWIEKSSFCEENMGDVVFSGVRFRDVVFEDCNLEKIRFKDCLFDDVKFKTCKAFALKFEDCEYKAIEFVKCDLECSEVPDEALQG